MTTTFKHLLVAVLMITAAAQAGGRERIDRDWKFSLGDASCPQKDFTHGTEYFSCFAKYRANDSAKSPAGEDFDDSGWQTVSLPHDWVVDLPFSPEASHSHGYKCIGWKYPGNSVGWYRKKIFIPEEDRGKQIWIEFEGIFRNSVVFCNGVYLGHEVSGYASRVYDLSDAIRYGKDNVITVRCDASLEEGWFYEGAGIYRHVWLHKSGPAAVKPYTLHIRNDGSDRIAVSGEISSSLDLDLRDLTVTLTVSDPDRKQVCRRNAKIDRNSLVFSSGMRIPAVREWSPESPDLYTIEVMIEAGGELSYRDSTRFGIRKMEFNGSDVPLERQGFLLNGRKVFLKGANLHQDHAGVGSGIPDEVWRYRIMRLKEFGFNAIRCSHNPASPAMLDLCDELGMLVIDENREMGVGEEQLGQFSNMIRRDRNHPCIIAWSIGNEEWSMRESGAGIALKMTAFAHGLDDTRPTTYGNSGGEYPIGDNVDVPGFNYFVQNHIDLDHESRPFRCAIGTEETTGCGTRGVDVTVPEKGWMAPLKDTTSVNDGWTFYTQRPWAAGLFYWTGIDYRGEPNPMVWPATGSQFGLFDYCGFPKEQVYSLWGQSNPVPDEKIAGTSFTASKKHLLPDGEDTVVIDVRSDSPVLQVNVGPGAEILGWGNGDPGFKYKERPGASDDRTAITVYPFQGLAQIIVRSLPGERIMDTDNIVRVDKLCVTARDGTRVRLDVVNAGIIRVRAVPQGVDFNNEESLCVLPQQRFNAYTVRDDRDSLVVSTSELTAKVSRSDGRVSFFRPDGTRILGEDRREFSPISVEGRDALTVRQVFDSPDDEAFYGLGQHQADEWNYKGRNEALYQYNTKISIPFIVSTKGYGLLWDSNSFCRWGDPRDYAQLGEVFTLRDKDGREGALTGTYVQADGKKVVRSEDRLNQEFLRTPECDTVINSLVGFNYDGAKVVYEGTLEPSETGLYRFILYYAGYTKVFVGSREVVPEIWRTAWNPNHRKFELELKAGERVPLRIEWLPDGGVSYCSLKVLSPVDELERNKQSWWGEMQPQIDYYFICGGRADDVISGYRTLTGKCPIPPKWAMGYWQSRERYTSQEQITDIVREFRRRGIPLDNIIQDWQYWKPDQWGSHEFDQERFPDPGKMIEDIHSMDCRYMISVWPKFYEGTEHFDEFDRNGWLYRVPVDENVIDWLGYRQTFYDAYDAGARKLFWDQMNEHLYRYGVDSWWMDASEPNIHDCTDMDYRKKMCGPTALGPSTQYFNAYSLMNAKAIYEGQRSVNPDNRVFLLTRNGFPGLQHYGAASWSGDIGTRWEDMKAQISAGLNYSVSGIPIWGEDIGGFSVEKRYMEAQQLYDRTGRVNADLKEWRELQTRWFEYGMWVPLFRAHGQWPFREPWNIAPEGTETYEAIVNCINLRYAYMPYIYSLACRLYFDDFTMMRPLVMDWPDDVTARGISDEYMFGDAVLVCPVCKYGARSREVYLPEGEWYLASTGEKFDGGRFVTADAPYGRIPVFHRAGQIIPMEKDGLTSICIFDGDRVDRATFTLYEDDGLTYAYEQGACSRIVFDWDSSRKVLRIAAREGSYKGMPAERDFRIVLVSGGEMSETVIHYDGHLMEIDPKK